MATRELGCPKCQAVFVADDARLQAPPGKIAIVPCPSCGWQGAGSKFERERRRQLEAAAKETDRARKRLEREARDAEEQCRREEMRTTAEAALAAAREATLEARRAEEDARAEEQRLLAERRRIMGETALNMAENLVYHERKVIRILGGAMGVLGLVLIGGVVLGIAGGPDEATWGFVLFYGGALLVALTGIWAAVERIEEKNRPQKRA